MWNKVQQGNYYYQTRIMYVFQWSYGVLLWEVITRGKVPYSGKKHHEVIEYVAEGGRLDRPEHCHPDM